jgi:type III secretion protein HrpB1
MSPPQFRKELVSGLVEIVSLAISQGRLEDGEIALAGLRVLRPGLPELDTFDAWLAMKRGAWSEAILVLTRLDCANSNWTLGKALLAFCQYATGDATWRASAEEVMERNDSAEAIGLMRMLTDPRGAMGEEAEEAAPDPAARAASAEMMAGSYLRA